jgi:hypothetical protein
LVCLKAGAADDIKEYEEWRKTKKHWKLIQCFLFHWSIFRFM